jgi:hypothetical protein
MSTFPAPARMPAAALTTLLRAARVRSLGWLLAVVLAGVGVARPPVGAAAVPAGRGEAVAGLAAREPAGGVSRLAERDARSFLAPDGAALRVVLRRGDAPVRGGPGGSGPAGRSVPPLRALPPPAGALRLLLLHPVRSPAGRALAAARDGTLSSASNGVPPPSLA